MSKAQIYRSPVDVALGLKSELEAYDKNKDRSALVGALRDQFLLNRLVASSKVEAIRDHSLNVLFGRVDKMSDSMLIKIIEVLSEGGGPDLAAIMGVQMPGKPPPIVSIQQAFGFAGGGSQSSLGGRTVSNPVQDPGDLVEAVERARAYLRGKATRQTEQEGE
jgi:hypothetical protein